MRLLLGAVRTPGSPVGGLCVFSQETRGLELPEPSTSPPPPSLAPAQWGLRCGAPDRLGGHLLGQGLAAGSFSLRSHCGVCVPHPAGALTAPFIGGGRNHLPRRSSGGGQTRAGLLSWDGPGQPWLQGLPAQPKLGPLGTRRIRGSHLGCPRWRSPQDWPGRLSGSDPPGEE